jgi:hypothetical protein
MWCLARGGPFNYLSDKYPQMAHFTNAYQKRTQSWPDGYTICCYDSFLAWRQAVRLAGTVEPVSVARALKGLRFSSLRGERIIRAVDGQMDCPTYFGKLVYTSRYPFAVWKSVMEIPAAKTWLEEDEIRRIRRKQ